MKSERVFTYEQSLEHVGKLACDQIRHSLKDAASDETTKELMRALPGIESAVRAACDRQAFAAKHGVVDLVAQ